MDRLCKYQRLRLFSWRLGAALLPVLTCVGPASAQQFPYMAYVTSEQAYVRCGPGQRYYPTGQISQGFAVEVYRHDSDHWCAVRPPEGSFSWVASHQVRPVGDGIVEIVGEHVVARVGSALSPDRSAVQVLLPKGERMELLAAKDSDDPRWVRIAAPAGEFRWVAAHALSRQPPIEAATPPEASGLAMDVVIGSPAQLQLAQFQALPSGGHPSTFEEAVGSAEELDLRISQVVILPPEQWELGTLEAAANRLLEETKSPPVRAQLREVRERITRFQKIQQRYNDPALRQPVVSVAGQRDPFEATNVADEQSPNGVTSLSLSVRERAREDLAGRNSRPARAGQPPSVDKPLYDATGLLKPVISKREQAPQYALVDAKGKVVSFITPTPDLNLKPYVGRRIGVHGKRGFMPEYRRAHVTVGRVTPLERTVRR